jgi:hypothetical protein
VRATLVRRGSMVGVAAEVDQADVGTGRRGGVDEPAGGRVDPVGGGRGVDQPLAELRGHAAVDRLLQQDPVQPRPLDGVGDGPVRQPPAIGDGAESPAGAAQQHVGGGGEAGGQPRQCALA